MIREDNAKMQTPRQRDREIYVAPKSEVTKFKERPKTSVDITTEEWATEVRMELDSRKSWSVIKEAEVRRGQLVSGFWPGDPISAKVRNRLLTYS